ncbi:Metacaspase type II [Mycena venus]|uniref:Metacaspase type II n=1 Tax=Mycena venus TaxID=2733690 RepID=A0A8H6TWL8_9AGAR|nr:Metacaspase type II [Mycena venus]
MLTTDWKRPIPHLFRSYTYLLANRFEPGSECKSCVHTRVDGQSYKALLVGIRGSVGADYPELKGSHKDVEEVQELLKDCYGYCDPDITILVDDGVHVQPTRNNILKAIRDLVKDAKAGDHFCFHYCGHSMQIPNRSGTEEDGLDECLIPSDGVEKHIVDNELNAALVLPLPAGCQLVAVLDTCHSGSLLDLRHNRCNRVVVPWIWPGKKRSDEIQHNVGRRNARLVSRAASILPGRKAVPPSRTPSTRLLARSSEINMNLMCQSPLRTISEAPGIAARGPGLGPKRTYTYRARTVSFFSAEKENDNGLQEGGDMPSALTGDFWVLPEGDQRCDSPTTMFECTGWCRDLNRIAPENAASSGGVQADVISLASCKDSELTYEDADGKSMTSALVETLRRNPNQSLKDVLVFVSHAVHTKTLLRHSSTKKYRKDVKDHAARVEQKNAQDHQRAMSFMIPERLPSPPIPSKTFPGPKISFLADLKGKLNFKRVVWTSKMTRPSGFDMDNFQNPELSSSRPLDMGQRFRL